MSEPGRYFEITILRPLQIFFLAFAILFLFKGMWWWLAGCAAGLFYLGIVGSNLHPLQSASDLSKGPLKGPAARFESELLPPAVKQMLVGHACTRVGILVGITVGVVFWKALGWHWYFALFITLLTMVYTSVLLKLAFKTWKV